MTLIIFILILSFLVLIHELGHYMVAKKNGIRVEEFGLGLPPKIFSKKIGETVYSLNILPFGGFVKLTGEDLLEQNATLNDQRSFAVKSPLQRAAVLVAGVTMNTLLAVVLYYILFFASGFKTLNLPLLFDYKFPFGTVTSVNTVITGFSENSPMSILNIDPGTAIVSINSEPVSTAQDIRRLVEGKAGQETQIQLKGLTGKEDFQNVSVVPQTDASGKGILGVYLGESATISYNKPAEKIFAGFLHSYNMLSYSLNVMGNLVKVSFTSRSLEPVSEGVSGPVGIYSVVGSILKIGGSQAVLTLLDFVALMSLSLALLNVFPFPALDGGRLAFVLIEKIWGKRVNPNIEATIHKWGMMALLALIFLVSVKDVLRFF